MAIYGTALLSLCLLIGLIIGQLMVQRTNLFLQDSTQIADS